jgi:hypothetical protein
MTDEEKTYNRISKITDEAAQIRDYLHTISRPEDFSIDFNDDFNSRRMAL